jgi:hypothetical protein
MLLSLMIVCAVGAVLLFALGAFDELRDVCKHPEHRAADNNHFFPDQSQDSERARSASIHTGRCS